jgi:4-amino-4-deoxy-L-arabinose transferase-like glycosyltransferase
VAKSKALWGLVSGFLALHVALAVWLPLVEDEAYYQLWASVPSAGYYDHPPMVAWGIAAGQAIFGPTLLGVRAASILAAALVVLLGWRIAWLFSRNETVAFRAALWGAVMLPFAALGFAATPDAGSVLFWSASVWALAEVVQGGNRNWWLLVGLFAGLGVLSKFTNLFFGVGLVLWLVASRDGRGWLKVWQVWIGAVIGVLVLVPLALWNMRNGYVGLERQFGRIGDVNGFSVGDSAAFWGSVIFLVTPLLFWLVLRAFRSGRVPPILIWVTAPIVLFLTYQATRSLAGGQWLVPVFPILAVMAALGRPKGWVARWAAPSAFGLAVLVMVLGLWPGKSLLGGHFFTQMRGWDDVRAQVLARVQAEGADWVATDAYGLTAQLGHYLGDDVTLRAVTRPERYLFLPPFPVDLCSRTALFISRTDFGGKVPYFAESRALPDILRMEGARELRRYYVARVSGLESCPP